MGTGRSRRPSRGAVALGLGVEYWEFASRHWRSFATKHVLPTANGRFRVPRGTARDPSQPDSMRATLSDLGQKADARFRERTGRFTDR